MNMKIAITKFFNKEKGFGFISNSESEYFIHISKLNNIEIEKGDVVAFECMESEKHKGKYEACNVELVTDDTAEILFEKISQNDLLILIERFAISFNRYLEKKASEYYSEFKEKARLHVGAFNRIEFANQIRAIISTGKNKKPGDDDSFWAYITSEYPKTDDPYLNKLNPHYRIETYSDRGFYSCYSMEDDYNRDYRDNDERKLPEVQNILQTNFLNNYYADEHINELISKYKIDYKREIKIMMTN
jgi:cold shock CspA family protein